MIRTTIRYNHVPEHLDLLYEALCIGLSEELKTTVTKKRLGTSLVVTLDTQDVLSLEFREAMMKYEKDLDIDGTGSIYQFQTLSNSKEESNQAI